MANLGGRPVKFESEDELEKKIEAYFESCWVEEKGKRKRIKPYTVSGLAVFLDCDRKTLINYEEKEGFFHTIKRAKQIIESDVEEGALVGNYNATASIFNLKNNFGWKDQINIDSEVNAKVQVLDDTRLSQLMAKATPEEIEKLVEADRIMAELEKR